MYLSIYLSSRIGANPCPVRPPGRDMLAASAAEPEDRTRLLLLLLLTLLSNVS